MNSDQIKRLEDDRTLPDKGQFLAGEDAYDKRAHELPTGTVPVPDPRRRPAEGDVVDDPAEQRATSPTPAPSAAAAKADPQAEEETSQTDAGK
jgi:hypothetical protein